jgi:ATP-dependent RNA helicase DHX57
VLSVVDFIAKCSPLRFLGKSTQLPAYILENDPIGSKIVVVQPRRIAATGVANRVAEERGEKHVGVDSVGYVVRGDTAICLRSRLVFCTTGVLLRQFQNEGALDCISTIIVDEVHERSLDIDILLGLLKKILPSTPHLQVVLMSATVDTERFRTYWGALPVPHIHIPGRTFPVSDYMLEDVVRFTGYVRSKKKKPSISTEKTNEPIPKDVDGFEERDLICQLIKHVVSNKDPSDDGSILVFLAGAPEIKKMEESIRAEDIGHSFQILPLHGGLQPREQARVFQPAKKGFTKVVLATNIAETSVTIPDCTVVIDTYVLCSSSFDSIIGTHIVVETVSVAGKNRPPTIRRIVCRYLLNNLHRRQV